VYAPYFSIYAAIFIYLVITKQVLRFFRFSASLKALLNTILSILPGFFVSAALRETFRCSPGVWSFASVVSLCIYIYAGVGVILMQCSGVNSENSASVNFDSMYVPFSFSRYIYI
jgi:hypothetical protein